MVATTFLRSPFMPRLCVIAQVPEECPEAVAQLIEQCLEKEVGARPNARQVSEHVPSSIHSS